MGEQCGRQRVQKCNDKLFGAVTRAEIGDAPAKMNGVEPEFFFDGGVVPKPFFEVMVGSLPILPFSGGRVDGTGVSTKIVNIKRFKNKGDISGGFLEIIKNKVGVF